MDMIIRNGTVVSATGSYKADVAVKDGKIAAVGSIPDIPGAKVVDAAGKLVLPGAIDAHTHLAMPFGGTVSSDDYFAGTRAAACGGTTTVFDFALQDFNETMTDTFNRRNALAAPDAAVDYSFHIGVKDIHGDLLDSIKDACDIGITSYKVFMVYDFGVKDGVFYQLLAKSKEFGALIAVHAENNELVNTLTEKYISEGKTDAWYHYMSRPEFVEGEADERAINLAKAANAPLYIVHLANKQGVEAVTKAKDEGYEIYAETCPQYLEFTSGVYKRADGRNFVCSPPMKGQESQDAIWEAIKRGDIDTIATDHCPFQQSEKDWGLNDFRKIPNGCAGIENMYPLHARQGERRRYQLREGCGAVLRQPGEDIRLHRQGRDSSRQGRGHRHLRPREGVHDTSGEHALRLRPHHLGGREGTRLSRSDLLQGQAGVR